MNFAYGWAFSKPVRKVFYNITITGPLGRRRARDRDDRARRPRRRTAQRSRVPSGTGSRASTSTCSASSSSGCSSPHGRSRSPYGASAASRNAGTLTSASRRHLCRAAEHCGDAPPALHTQRAKLRPGDPTQVNRRSLEVHRTAPILWTRHNRAMPSAHAPLPNRSPTPTGASAQRHALLESNRFGLSEMGPAGLEPATYRL